MWDLPKLQELIGPFEYAILNDISTYHSMHSIYGDAGRVGHERAQTDGERVVHSQGRVLYTAKTSDSINHSSLNMLMCTYFPAMPKGLDMRRLRPMGSLCCTQP